MSDENALWIAVAAVAVFFAVAIVDVWAGWWLAEHLSSAPVAPGSPPELVRGWWRAGEVDLPNAAKVWGAVVAVVTFGGLAYGWLRFDRRRGGQMGALARRLPRGRSGTLRPYLRGTGPRIGRIVGRIRKPEISMTHEDLALVIAGPRSFKTMTLVIPSAAAHAGPCLVTSNKRDVWDLLQGPRSEQGDVWLFDPENLTGKQRTTLAEAATFWWNPLSMVNTVNDAKKLAKVWLVASREKSGEEGFWDAEAINVIAPMLLAASKNDLPITVLHGWLALPSDREPSDLLRAAGFDALALGLDARRETTERTRSSIYATARQIAEWLDDPEVVEWITPHPTRREFRHDQLATSTDTIIMLSEDGAGAWGPLIASMTRAILESSKQHAADHGGRLDPYMLCVLDEVCNICRIDGLPGMVSHYGSRGILLQLIAQSYDQLETTFGPSGAGQILSSCAMALYLGAERDDKFLEQISKLTGEWEQHRVSHSMSTGGHRGVQRSRSMQVERRAVLDVAELGALPRGYAVALLYGTRPVLLEMRPWWKGPHAKAIEASLSAATSPTTVSTDVSTEEAA